MRVLRITYMDDPEGAALFFRDVSRYSIDDLVAFEASVLFLQAAPVAEARKFFAARIAARKAAPAASVAASASAAAANSIVTCPAAVTAALESLQRPASATAGDSTIQQRTDPVVRLASAELDVVLGEAFTSGAAALPLDDHVRALNKEAEEIVARTTSSVKVTSARSFALKALQRLVHQLFDGAYVPFVFGSTAWELDSPSSDLDVTLLHAGSLQPLEEPLRVPALRKLSKSVRRSFSVEAVMLNGRLPLISLTHVHEGVRVALQVCCTANHVALKTQAVRTLVRAHPLARPLFLVVKHWAKARHIINASQGGFNSFAFLMLVLQYLQLRATRPLGVLFAPPALPASAAALPANANAARLAAAPADADFTVVDLTTAAGRAEAPVFLKHPTLLPHLNAACPVSADGGASVAAASTPRSVASAKEAAAAAAAAAAAVAAAEAAARPGHRRGHSRQISSIPHIMNSFDPSMASLAEDEELAADAGGDDDDENDTASATGSTLTTPRSKPSKAVSKSPAAAAKSPQRGAGATPVKGDKKKGAMEPQMLSTTSTAWLAAPVVPAAAMAEDARAMARSNALFLGPVAGGARVIVTQSNGHMFHAMPRAQRFKTLGTTEPAAYTKSAHLKEHLAAHGQTGIEYADTLGDVLAGFFAFYATVFSPALHAVSVREGHLVWAEPLRRAAPQKPAAAALYAPVPEAETLPAPALADHFSNPGQQQHNQRQQHHHKKEPKQQEQSKPVEITSAPVAARGAWAQGLPPAIAALKEQSAQQKVQTQAQAQEVARQQRENEQAAAAARALEPRVEQRAAFEGFNSSFTGILIEDPLDPTDNVARGVTPRRLHAFFIELARAHIMLSTHQRSFAQDVCEEVTQSVANLHDYLSAGPNTRTVRGPTDFIRISKVFASLLEEVSLEDVVARGQKARETALTSLRTEMDRNLAQFLEERRRRNAAKRASKSAKAATSPAAVASAAAAATAAADSAEAAAAAPRVKRARAAEARSKAKARAQALRSHAPAAAAASSTAEDDEAIDAALQEARSKAQAAGLDLDEIMQATQDKTRSRVKKNRMSMGPGAGAPSPVKKPDHALEMSLMAIQLQLAARAEAQRQAMRRAQQQLNDAADAALAGTLAKPAAPAAAPAIETKSTTPSSSFKSDATGDDEDDEDDELLAHLAFAADDDDENDAADSSGAMRSGLSITVSAPGGESTSNGTRSPPRSSRHSKTADVEAAVLLQRISNASSALTASPWEAPTAPVIMLRTAVGADDDDFDDDDDDYDDDDDEDDGAAGAGVQIHVSAKVDVVAAHASFKTTEPDDDDIPQPSMRPSGRKSMGGNAIGAAGVAARKPSTFHIRKGSQLIGGNIWAGIGLTSTKANGKSGKLAGDDDDDDDEDVHITYA